MSLTNSIHNCTLSCRSLISTFIVTTERYRTTVTEVLRKCCAKDARRSLSGDKSAAPSSALFLALRGKRGGMRSARLFRSRERENCRRVSLRRRLYRPVSLRYTRISFSCEHIFRRRQQRHCH